MPSDQRADNKDKEKPSKSDKKLLIGFILNCKAELKLLLILLLLLCSLATLFPFLPSSFFSITTSCISTTSAIATTTTTTHPPPPPPPPPLEQSVDNDVIKRSLIPYGVAAYSFILMSAYRGGATSFAVMGLASKPLHVYARPTYTCVYQTKNNTISIPAFKFLPDWGFGRVYTTVVVNCSFPDNSPVADVTSGGTLLVNVTTNGGFDRSLNLTDSIIALVEPPSAWNLTRFVSPPKYDYLYCGSPLYGNLSPQRVREWIAYHARLFGSGSHFVIYDAGGVHPEVMEVLRPWMELGFVTLHDVREQERFDAYYHNQFIIVNDCLHRYRFDAKWIFFFDLDEFLFISPKSNIKSVMDGFKGYTQLTFEQMPMSSNLCLIEDAPKTTKKWGFEKLVYRDVKRVARKDRKYAIQPRNVFATGVHKSQDLHGKTTTPTHKLISYFHYHATIANRRELCRRFANETSVTVEGTPYTLDKALRSMAPLVKTFELNTIGPRLLSTRQ